MGLFDDLTFPYVWYMLGCGPGEFLIRLLLL